MEDADGRDWGEALGSKCISEFDLQSERLRVETVRGEEDPIYYSAQYNRIYTGGLLSFCAADVCQLSTMGTNRGEAYPW